MPQDEPAAPNRPIAATRRRIAAAVLMVALLALAAGLPGAESDGPGHGQAVNRAAKADRLELRP